jgi:hypothetical protein
VPRKELARIVNYSPVEKAVWQPPNDNFFLQFFAVLFAMLFAMLRGNVRAGFKTATLKTTVP